MKGIRYLGTIGIDIYLIINNTNRFEQKTIIMTLTAPQRNHISVGFQSNDISKDPKAIFRSDA